MSYESEFDKKIAAIKPMPREAYVYTQSSTDEITLAATIQVPSGTDEKSTNSRYIAIKEGADGVWSRIREAQATAFVKVLSTYNDQEMYSRKLPWPHDPSKYIRKA